MATAALKWYWALLIALLVTGLVAAILICVPLDMHFLVNRERYFPAAVHRAVAAISHTPELAVIPRILHQTWKTDDLLDFQAENRAKWLFHLDQRYGGSGDGGGEPFTHYLHTDADFDGFVSEHYPWFLETWNKLEPFIKKVDAIRYMWLHHYGGIYADLDLKLIDPQQLFDFVEREYSVPTLIMSSTSTHVALARTGPVFMMTHPGHDFWLKFLREIQTRHHLPTCHATGPDAMMATLRKYVRNRATRAGNLLLIPSSKVFKSLPHSKPMTFHTNSSLWKKDGKEQ